MNNRYLNLEANKKTQPKSSNYFQNLMLTLKTSEDTANVYKHIDKYCIGNTENILKKMWVQTPSFLIRIISLGFWRHSESNVSITTGFWWVTTPSVPEKCMVSQILSSLIFAGSRIQVPNVCCTLTKWTGLPTDVMTHASREKAHVRYLWH